MKTKTRLTQIASFLAFTLTLLPTAAPAQALAQEWVQRFGGTSGSGYIAKALAVDHGNNVVLIGNVGTIKYSSAGLPLWTNYLNGAMYQIKSADALAIDANDNVLVTGNSYDAGWRDDSATIKYSSAGVPLWTNRHDRAGQYDFSSAIVVDASGNSYVAGYSEAANYSPDYLTIKYSSAGVLLWVKYYDEPGYASGYARALAVDASGNVYVTGDSWVDTRYILAVIKYSSAGVPLWTNRYNGATANKLALDNSGNVYVAGGFNNDFLTLKYSSAGALLWTNIYNGPANGVDSVSDLVLDTNGNLYVTGSSPGTNGNDYLTLKYSSTGVPLWTNRYDGPAHRGDVPQQMAKDAGGNIYVTGYSANETNDDYLTIAYSSAGVPLWTNRYNGPGNGTDHANAVGVDAGANVYVTGHSRNSSGKDDYTTIKYSIVPPISLVAQPVDHQLVLSWTNALFSLQAAPTITDTFTNVPGATSPWTNSLIGAQQFFRLATP